MHALKPRSHAKHAVSSRNDPSIRFARPPNKQRTPSLPNTRLLQTFSPALAFGSHRMAPHHIARLAGRSSAAAVRCDASLRGAILPACRHTRPASRPPCRPGGPRACQPANRVCRLEAAAHARLPTGKLGHSESTR